MRYIAILMLALSLQAGEAPDTKIDTVQDAMAMVGKLPDPQVAQHLHDFFREANPEAASQVLMHIAISSARPAREHVLPMLSHNDALVVDRALRAMTAIGVANVDQRLMVEGLLTHEKPMVAEQAAICLGAGDDMRVVPALIGIMHKDNGVGEAALRSLKRLSGADFKNDKEQWEAWYRSNRLEASERLGGIASRLGSEDEKEQLAAIQALGRMRTDRMEAIDMLEPMLKSENDTLVLATRQSLAVLAPEQYSMPTQREIASVAKVEPPPAVKSGVMNYLASQGFFDTWWGLLVTAFTVICILALVLFVLRSPPVKNATNRIARVVVAGTARFARPITKRIRRGTDRIANAIKKKNQGKAVEK